MSSWDLELLDDPTQQMEQLKRLYQI